MKAYISVSYNRRMLLQDALNAIRQTLTLFNVVPFVFVDEHRFAPAAEKQMMQQAMQDINDSDLLIAETSDKEIGIGIEVGYAKAKNKPVIYVRHKNAEHSTTTSGIADYTVVYDGVSDLQNQLSAILIAVQHR